MDVFFPGLAPPLKQIRFVIGASRARGNNCHASSEFSQLNVRQESALRIAGVSQRAAFLRFWCGLLSVFLVLLELGSASLTCAAGQAPARGGGQHHLQRGICHRLLLRYLRFHALVGFPTTIDPNHDRNLTHTQPSPLYTRFEITWRHSDGSSFWLPTPPGHFVPFKKLSVQSRELYLVGKKLDT